MMPEELTPELREKAQACKSVEEILDLAKEEGYELSDEQLESMSGGERAICKRLSCSRFFPTYPDMISQRPPAPSH